MHLFPIGVAVLVALAIMTIGVMYLARPATVMPSFGLALPGDEVGMVPWVRLKGSRDLASGLVVLALVAWGDHVLLGVALAILAIIPIGDMSVILAAKGSARTAFTVHGLTAALMMLAAAALMAGAA